jgi:hypothetical protein
LTHYGFIRRGFLKDSFQGDQLFFRESRKIHLSCFCGKLKSLSGSALDAIRDERDSPLCSSSELVRPI